MKKFLLLSSLSVFTLLVACKTKGINYDVNYDPSQNIFYYNFDSNVSKDTSITLNFNDLSTETPIQHIHFENNGEVLDVGKEDSNNSIRIHGITGSDGGIYNYNIVDNALTFNPITKKIYLEIQISSSLTVNNLVLYAYNELPG